MTRMSERLRALRHLPPDVAEGDDAERLVRERRRDRQRDASIRARADGAVVLGDLAGDRDEQPEGVVRDLRLAEVRVVRDDDASLGGGGDVERVEPDPVADDQFEAGQAVEERPVDACAPDEDALRLRQQRRALLLVRGALDDDPAAGGLDDRTFDLEPGGVGGLGLDGCEGW
jgi:hypothetical protein